MKKKLISLGNEVKKGELQLRFSQIWKGFLYLESEKKKKLDFKVIRRKCKILVSFYIVFPNTEVKNQEKMNKIGLNIKFYLW